MALNTVTVPTTLGGSGTTYSDGTDMKGMAGPDGLGYKDNLLPMLKEFVALGNSTLATSNATINSTGIFAWVNGNTYAQGVVTWSPIDFLNYRKKTASSVTTTDPSADAVNWVPFSNVLTASDGESKIGTVALGTGSIPRPQRAKNRDIVSLLEYAQPNQLADDGPGLQRAINATQGTGITIYAPGSMGTYTLTTGALATGPICIEGDSRTATIFNVNTATGTGIAVDTPSACQFERFRMFGTGAGNTATALSFTGTGSGNFLSVFRDIQIDTIGTAINFLAAFGWVFDASYILNVGTGLNVANSRNADAGDPCITNSFFTNCVTAVNHTSSGGLKIIGNKFNIGTVGYRFNWSAGAVSSDLIIVGNSFENYTSRAIQFTSVNTTGSFGNIVITSNQFALNANCLIFEQPMQFGTVVIGSNSMIANSANSIGIQVINVFRLTLDATIDSNNAAGSIGVTIASTVTTGKLGTLNITNTATPYSNGSTGVFGTLQKPQGGTATVTCSTAYASLFSGSVAVTFPVAYSIPPKVNCTPGSVAGAISAFASAITTTGFTLNAYSVTNGGTGSATWEAMSIL